MTEDIPELPLRTAWATVLVGGKRLAGLLEAVRLFPEAIDQSRAEAYKVALLDELREAMAHPQIIELEGLQPLAGNLDEVALEAHAQLNASAAVLGLAKELGTPFGGGSREQIEAFVANVYSQAGEISSWRCQEIMRQLEPDLIFACQVPAYQFEADLQRRRFGVYQFGSYWNAYQSYLSYRGTAPMWISPNPLARFELQFKKRMLAASELTESRELTKAVTTLFDRVLDPESGIVWDEFVQPVIEEIALEFESVRLEFGGGSFQITAAEDLFLRTAALALSATRDHIQNEWDRILTNATSRHARGKPTQTESETLTVMYVDVVGSTELYAANGDVTALELIAARLGAARNIVVGGGGVYRKGTGDGLIATFRSVVGSVSAAVEVQTAPDQSGLPLRIGIHIGEVFVTSDDDIAGLAVNVADRICGQADVGGICLSAPVAALLSGSGADLTDRGEVEIRGLDGRHRLFDVMLAEIPAT
ncbi:MAG: adenylate/guanylate cyclase domain-containing protein [Dehalococcoidia bacterium]